MKKYEPISWITRLSSHLIIGPKPSTKNHVGYLVVNGDVDVFINICSSKDEHRSTYVEKIDVVLDDNGMREKRTVETLDFAFDPVDYKPKGRDEKAKRADMASYYVRHAERIWLELQTLKEFETLQCYLHAKRGTMEEVMIGFALWFLMTKDKQSLPRDPCQWIVDEKRESLLEEDNEQKALLQAMWTHLHQLESSRKFFSFSRKKPKQEQGSAE